MKKTDFIYLLPIAFIFCLACIQLDKQEKIKPDGPLFPQGEEIFNENFNGIAYLQMLVRADSVNDITVGNVTFEPGARTKWHSHPAGQILLVTDGLGYYQEKGQPKKILKKGDVVRCPPGIAHWHGASPDQVFVQLAISSNRNGGAIWLHPVTDDEYRN